MSKKKIIASSILSLAMCASVITGATFALATSNSEVNIAVQAGKVNVTATITNLKTYSAQANANNSGYDEVAQTEGATETFGSFVNGGTAEIKDGTLTLDRMIHGDKATFDIVLENKSNINVQYQTVIQTIEDTGLFAGLEVEIDGQSFNGFTAVADWKFLEENAPVEKSTWSCSVSLPIDADSNYQDKFTKLSVSVNAVQGNAIVETLDENTVGIYTVTDMVSFAKSVNEGGNEYAGKTVKLMKNIDLAGIDWTPIGQTGATTFNGVFDGQGYTISNMTVDESNLTSADDGAGLFGWIEEHTASVQIKNVNIDKANVKGHQYAGGLVGYIGGSGAHVISACSVTNSTLEANKSVGAIFGHTGTNVLTVSKVTATDNTITGVLVGREWGVGAIFGRSNGDSITKLSEATISGNTISQPEAKDSATSEYYGKCYGMFVLDGKVSGSASSSEALDNMFIAADSVTLTDGDFSTAITVPEGKELIVENATLDTSANYGIGVSAGANSTIILSGGSIKAFDYAQVIATSNGANIVITDGDYAGGMAVMPSENVDVIINGGTFDLEIVIVGESSSSAGSKIVINGGSFTVPAILNNQIFIEITGGTFNIDCITEYPTIVPQEYITITGGTFSVDPTAYLADGYTAEQNDLGMWVVTAK